MAEVRNTRKSAETLMFQPSANPQRHLRVAGSADTYNKYLRSNGIFAHRTFCPLHPQRPLYRRGVAGVGVRLVLLPRGSKPIPHGMLFPEVR